jgi:hypothetical protein
VEVGSEATVDTQGIGQAMIEHYAELRRQRLFHAHGGDYVLRRDSAAGRFHVYLRARGSSPDVVEFRARSFTRFPHAERTRLLEWVNRFNDRIQWLPASVRNSRYSADLAVVGNSRFCVADAGDFAAFVRFADLFLAVAAKLFEGVDAEMKLPTPAELELWFQRSG